MWASRRVIKLAKTETTIKKLAGFLLLTCFIEKKKVGLLIHYEVKHFAPYKH